MQKCFDGLIAMFLFDERFCRQSNIETQPSLSNNLPNNLPTLNKFMYLPSTFLIYLQGLRQMTLQQSWQTFENFSVQFDVNAFEDMVSGSAV